MRTNLMNRDLHDAVSDVNGKVLDVQPAAGASIFTPKDWDTVVFLNDQDTKVVLRQHRPTGAVRIKAIPAVTVDMVEPEPYEIQLMPDVPFRVLTILLENL
jgi:hypothetical protein